MILKKYKFLLKHDEGTALITTVASSKEAAIEIVMKAELCPRGAIKFLLAKPLKIKS